MSWLPCSGVHHGGPSEAPGWWGHQWVGGVDDPLSSESGGLRQPGAGGRAPGEVGSSLGARPPGSHPSAPGVVVRLVMGDDQGIGVGGVTGLQPLAVTRQRQGPDVSCGAHPPRPRGAAAGRAGPKGAKQQWVMEAWVLKPQAAHHPPPKSPRPHYLGAVHLTVSDGGPRAPTISVAIAVGPVVTGGATGASWKCQGRERLSKERRGWGVAAGLQVAESGSWPRPIQSIRHK